MKKIILVHSVLIVQVFAHHAAGFVVSGNTGLTIGQQEVCNFREIDARAIQDANTKCYYFYSRDSKAVEFIVTKEWEARVPYCGQAGECGYRHECVLSWQSSCEK